MHSATSIDSNNLPSTPRKNKSGQTMSHTPTKHIPKLTSNSTPKVPPDGHCPLCDCTLKFARLVLERRRGVTVQGGGGALYRKNVDDVGELQEVVRDKELLVSPSKSASISSKEKEKGKKVSGGGIIDLCSPSSPGIPSPPFTPSTSLANNQLNALGISSSKGGCGSSTKIDKGEESPGKRKLSYESGENQTGARIKKVGLLGSDDCMGVGVGRRVAKEIYEVLEIKDSDSSGEEIEDLT